MNKIRLNLAACLFAMSSFFTPGTAADSLQVDASQLTVWKFKTDAAVVATPVVKKDTVYIGSLDGNLYALDLNTGKENWRFNSASPIRSTAVIAGKSILFESGNKLYALDKKGKQQWQFVLADVPESDQLDPWDIHHPSVVIKKNIAYIGTENGLAFGINIKDGEQAFKYQTPNKHTIRSTAAVHKNQIIFGDWEGVLYSFDIGNAEMLWQYDTRKDATFGWKNAIQTTPVIHAGAVYFAGRSSRLYSLDIKTGLKNWMHVSPTDQWLLGGPTLDGNTLYFRLMLCKSTIARFIKDSPFFSGFLDVPIFLI